MSHCVSQPAFHATGPSWSARLLEDQCCIHHMVATALAQASVRAGLLDVVLSAAVSGHPLEAVSRVCPNLVPGSQSDMLSCACTSRQSLEALWAYGASDVAFESVVYLCACQRCFETLLTGGHYLSQHADFWESLRSERVGCRSWACEAPLRSFRWHCIHSCICHANGVGPLVATRDPPRGLSTGSPLCARDHSAYAPRGTALRVGAKQI